MPFFLGLGVKKCKRDTTSQGTACAKKGSRKGNPVTKAWDVGRRGDGDTKIE